MAPAGGRPGGGGAGEGMDPSAGIRHTARWGGSDKVAEEETHAGGKATLADPADLVEGLLTVCAECRRVIRLPTRPSGDGSGLVSHGICPECARRLYGRLFKPRGGSAGC